MRYTLIVATFMGAALASPVPQELDWDAIDDLDPVPTPDIPVVSAAAAATTISYAAAPAASSVKSAVMADPTDTSLKVKRDDNSGCAVQPKDYDYPDQFVESPGFGDAANSAMTPTGYTQAYVNQLGSSQGVYGYMGFTVLPAYDVQACSKQCDNVRGCSSFNIYFERDPGVDPAAGCTNPPSQTVIKCVFYGGPAIDGTQTNTGQQRMDFEVVIAGSNAYVNNSIATPKGYSGAVSLASNAINAPLDCNGKDTYMGVKIFTQGPFDASLCAAACSAQSDYNRKHPNKNGYFQTCQFFNTYVLYKNNAAVGQYCSLYNETWPASYATNTGSYRGSDHYTMSYSYAFSNTTGTLDVPVGCTNKASP